MANHATNDPNRHISRGRNQPASKVSGYESPLHSNPREQRSRHPSRLLQRGELQLLPRRLSRRLHLPPFVELFDVRFFQMKKNYLGQAALAAIVMLAVLLLVDSVADAILAAGLGSSVVMVFVHPGSRNSTLRHLVGGHLLGLAVGILAAFLFFHSTLLPVPAEMSHWAADVIAAAALGIVILLMSVTDTEHPPAAATSLGFALQSPDLTMTALFAGGVLLLALSKILLRSVLQDLD